MASCRIRHLANTAKFKPKYTVSGLVVQHLLGMPISVKHDAILQAQVSQKSKNDFETVE
jgi:hypothetical protein